MAKILFRFGLLSNNIQVTRDVLNSSSSPTGMASVISKLLHSSAALAAHKKRTPVLALSRSAADHAKDKQLKHESTVR